MVKILPSQTFDASFAIRFKFANIKDYYFKLLLGSNILCHLIFSFGKHVVMKIFFIFYHLLFVMNSCNVQYWTAYR